MAGGPPVGDQPDVNPFLEPSGDQRDQMGSGQSVVWIIIAVLLACMLVCGGVLIALVLPAIGAARQSAQRIQRINQIKQVGLALHDYHDTYKRFPAAVSANSNGEEVFGWRYSISPFVDGKHQWDAFDQEQPWDSVANRRVTQQAPPALQAVNKPLGQTSIFTIVCDEGVFVRQPNVGETMASVSDGTSYTILAMELPHLSTPWTSTKNLTPDEAYEAITQLDDSDEAYLLMVDAQVLPVRNNLDREKFDALLTREGGELVPGLGNDLR